MCLVLEGVGKDLATLRSNVTNTKNKSLRVLVAEQVFLGGGFNQQGGF